MTRPEPGAPRITADVALLRRLRAEGFLLGFRALEALVDLRRARDFGRGPARLVEAIHRLGGIAPSSSPSTARTSA